MSELQAPRLIPNHDQLQTLKQLLIDSFKPLLQGRKVLLIDIPVHLNVGDLLIHAGEEKLFELLSCQVVGRISARNARQLDDMDLAKDVVLLLHGGGNFGDLYPLHQSLRERVIESFPDHSIVVLPQSIHFNDPNALQRTAPIYQQHQHLTFCVRDQASAEVIRSILPAHRVKLLPDMAFTLLDHWRWPTDKPSMTLALRRRDIEACAEGGSQDVDRFDWDDLFSRRDDKLYSLLRYAFRTEDKIGVNLATSRMWWWYVQSVINRASRHFDKYGCVDTDRLHGMILALLMGRDVVMRDNSYGKLRRYAAAWLQVDSDTYVPSNHERVVHE
ncbi:polysaccharide pyruvyl transferase family protein [Neiella marina]|nr:polysaccharide pyruvyl transferase family protein [Neiella marina]